ncbi:EAL domain-containing protein [Aliidiomarina halalkaliphila]|uniref:cyclic-guanylate-specific phosphodiesterase n=1 Tax=Aliidiomarina halalkaliphila TaxID=2593535 RepID=A0A552WZS3_9GAMM|nr:GGDEF domain-containing phosphodiesterase [Aliidiomarina halalkaliphila]TRW48322.1 EAL domain-containing protein [Aliidiomarina halalkaliphila]
MLFSDEAVLGATNAGQGLMVLGFALLLTHYFRLYRRPYLRFWSYAAVWFGCSSAVKLVINASHDWLTLPSFVVSGLETTSLALMYVALGLLAIGVFDITVNRIPERRARWRIYFGCLVIALFTSTELGPVGDPLTWQPFFKDASLYLISAITLGIIGGVILAQSTPTMGPRLIASAFLLQAIKNVFLVSLLLLDSTWLSSQLVWVITGIVNVVFLTSAMLGITIWLLEAERHRAVDAIQKAEYVNTHDALTGIENRDELMTKLPVFIDSCRGDGRELVLFMLGVDRFKAINDTMGLRGGDRVLVELSQRLQNLQTRPVSVARISGDVFVVIYDHVRGREDISNLGYDLQRIIQKPMLIDGKTMNITCSIGVSRFPQQGSRAEGLLSKANIALANAKLPESPSVVFYRDGMDDQYIKLVDMEPELRKALLRNEFVVHLQPIFDVRTQYLSGFEALLRWQHPIKGMLNPDSFLPFVEQLGLSSEVDDWVLRHCAKLISRWRAQGEKVLPIAVNLSARHFQQPELTDKLRRLFREYQLKAGDLELEITENVAMSDITTGMNVLNRLRDMGIRVAIDDFGTGYSSLAYLRKLPVDKIKIDRSFINELMASKEDSTIVRTLIELSHVLNKQIVAEGVETAEQFAMLSEMHCDSVQGFYFSPPVNEEKSRGILQKFWREFLHLSNAKGNDSGAAPGPNTLKA